MTILIVVCHVLKLAYVSMQVMRLKQVRFQPLRHHTFEKESTNFYVLCP